MLENVFNSIHGSTVDEMIETFNEAESFLQRKHFKKNTKKNWKK
jgi:hypothetical protein